MYQIEMNCVSYALHTILFLEKFQNIVGMTAQQNFLKRPTWEELAEKSRMNFVHRIHYSGFDTLSRLFIRSL